MKWVAVALVFVLLPGCDDDDEDVADAAVDAAVDAEVDDAATDADVEDDADVDDEESLAAVLADDPDFSTLVSAVTEADLLELLETSDALTVFAPTNDAFVESGVTSEVIDALTQDELERLLQYHIIEGQALQAEDLEDGEIQTAAGVDLEVDTTDGVQLNGGRDAGGADVTVPDVEARNGVIHVIDRVLMPPAAT